LLKDGIVAAKGGNKVQARQLLRQATDLDARSEAAWLWLAGLAEAPLEAVHFLERVLALNPGHEKAGLAIRAARLQAGVAAAKVQDKVQARLLLRKAVEQDPGSEMGWLWLASVAETAEEAMGLLEKVLQLNPANQRAQAALERYRAHQPAAPPPVPQVATPSAELRKDLSASQPAGRISNPSSRGQTDGLEIRPAAPPAPPKQEEVDEAPAAPLPAQPDKPEVPTPGPTEPASSILDDSVHITSSAQSETKIELAEEIWECLFCQAQSPEPLERCPECNGILSLDHVETFFKPLSVDQEKVNAAIERLEQIDPETDFATAYQLGLAYLNLKQFDTGIEFLQTAVELVPGDEALGSQVERLIAYRLSVTHSRSREHGKRKTILVVDDSPTIRKVVTMTVERRGYATRSAADGYEAVDAIRDWGVPDLILLDITMPGMDGYQLCKLLRQNADTTNIPIIMLSGKDGFFSKVRGRMAGSTEYITKPFEPESLLRTIERYCVPDGPAGVPASTRKR